MHSNTLEVVKYFPTVQPTRCNCCYLPLAAAVWHIPLLYTQFWAPDDGWKDRPKHVERFTRINNLRSQVHVVGCTIGIYYDAQT